MNFYQLELFVAVVEHGSFTRAAEALHMSQPAISSRIRALEASIGEPLFEQVGRRLYLTEAGRELQSRAQDILHQVSETKQAMAELHSLERGTLRVAATTTVGTYILPGVLGEFHRAYPSVALVLDVTNEVRTVELVQQDRMDLGVLGMPQPLEDMVAEFLMPNQLFIAAAASHPLARRKSIPFSEVAAYPLVVREQGAGSRSVIDQIYQTRGLKPIVAMELRQNVVINQAIIAGLGLGLLSSLGVQRELAEGRMVWLDVEGLSLTRNFHIIHRRGRRLPRAAAAFKEMMLAQVASNPT